ncbi:MAG: GtrA family protein [Oscillospiraceae bacterium]|nr:GtrA family protein [Oscillospiraceae bacterium]
MKKIRDLIERYYDVLAYLFFGGLTTVVNYLVYLPCFNWWGNSSSVSNMIAWVFAVAFAFLTNKPFVFKSHDWSAKTLWPELTKFVGCRLGSGVLETAILWLTVDILLLNGNWMKLITSVLVIVANYFGSKFLVFIKKK